jgi:pyridoxal biosynthesis lyase PdxS
MDVMNVEQAKIAEEAGAVAVMALERIPANIRRDGGVARMVSTYTARGAESLRENAGMQGAVQGC